MGEPYPYNDGHPVSGTIPFSIGNIQGGLPKDQQNQASGLPAADIVIERVLLYTGFSLFMGAALFQPVWHRPENGWPGDKKRRLKRITNVALLLTGAAIIIQQMAHCKQKQTQAFPGSGLFSLRF